MPEFTYVGVAKDGTKVQGKLDAPSEGEVRMMLRGQGIRPQKISTVSLVNADLAVLISGGVTRVPIDALVAFTRQLHVLVGSGVPLVQALEVLHEQAADRTLKNILVAVKEKVSQGSYLWEALGAYPNSFPKIYIALIRAGESAGAMEQMLKRLSRYMEDAERLRRMLKSAMMYPIVVVSIGVAVVALMLTLVIPKFEELLTSSGQELPGPTKFVIDLSHFMVGNLVWIAGSTALILFLGMKYFRSPEGRAALDRFTYRMPIFGALAQKGGVARFARTMSTLLSSGVPLVDAIDICKATIDNAVLEDSVGKIRGDIEAGKSMGSVVNKLSVFPKMAVQMIMVGENTGNLDTMLEKVADFYEEEVETIVGGLSKLIEPIVLIFLGTTVGGLMIAMYLPIFKLAGGADE